MKFNANILLLLAVALTWVSCSSPSFNFKEKNAKPISHEKYDALLTKHVDDKGDVDYKGFLKDSTKFDVYLDLLSDNPPAKDWTDDQKKAYWINAYNAFTIKLIMNNYPVKSITDLSKPGSIGIINGVWHEKFFKIGGNIMNLNAIEHRMLRKKFDDPRIHFAIVCASKSCPKLLNKAYTAEKLDQQLTQQAKDFLADDFRNEIKSPTEANVSKIFTWFKGDFTKKGTLIEFINKYSPTQIEKGTNLGHTEYDWSLNEQ